MTDFLKLNIEFDPAKLLADLNICLKFSWREHFNVNYYSGAWNIFSLRSASGNYNDINSNAPNGDYQDTEILKECKYFQEVMDFFKCPKESVRLMNLILGSEISEHSDVELRYKSGTFRLHVPIQTNNEVEFVINGKRALMQQGECWYGNFEAIHSVKNYGKTDRVHLVIDCKRNEWTDNFFKLSGFDFNSEFTNEEKSYNQDELKLIIAELQSLNTEKSLELAEEFKKKLL